ncbi:MAG: lipopolysaccharide transport system permease protein [bacterium F082]|nr:MAG: lipopolysaccharide transport system permease protein [bacterium F082]KWW31110.1 MAG: lipopolysaccharide transport system permease protein [bacterium P201]
MAQTVSENENWTTIIKPRNKLFEVNLKEIWDYRDLLTLFVKRNIITQYKQTILGPLWFVIQPALTVLMYMVVFGGIAGIPTDGVPQPLFYLGGICMWQYFSSCLTSTSNTFVSNAGIFGKVYFPRLIMPLATVTSNLVRFGIQVGLFVIVYVYYAIIGQAPSPNWYLLLFPVLVVMMAGLALGFGIIISSMTTKYRDLQVLFSFVVQLWMYATPIVYPLSQVAGKVKFGVNVYKVMCINPVTPIIETFKYGSLGAGEFIGWGWLAYSFAFMIVLLSLGILTFNRVQKSFMDTV